MKLTLGFAVGLFFSNCLYQALLSQPDWGIALKRSLLMLLVLGAFHLVDFLPRGKVE